MPERREREGVCRVVREVEATLEAESLGLRVLDPSGTGPKQAIDLG
jgi:hypothetical protein